MNTRITHQTSCPIGSAKPCWHRHALALTLAGLASAAAAPSLAATADISGVPLGTATVTAKPNVMFILDDSGSMARAYMPDEMSDSGSYGYYSTQCNGLAFDPDPKVTYDPPVKADGTSYPDAKTFWPDVPDDGYAYADGSNTSTSNLSRDDYYAYTGGQKPARQWTYLADGTVVRNTFTTECFSQIGTTSGVFTLTTVAASLQQKYANWWAYYRTRILVMRSAAGAAFKRLDSKYRVGFTVISDETVTSDKFLDTNDFDATQKTSFYNLLYSAMPNGFTPLRGALSKVGRYYGNRAPQQRIDPAAYKAVDPVSGAKVTKTYECQRNYAMLSTDGLWNVDSSFSTVYNNGFKLDTDAPVGQQDGAEVTPMKDGTSSRVSRQTTWQRVDKVRTDISGRRSTLTFNRTAYTARTGTCTQTNGNPGVRARAQLQEATQVITFKQGTYFNATRQYVESLLVVNNIEQPPPVKGQESTVGNPVPTGEPQVITITNTGNLSAWSDVGGTTNVCIPAVPAAPFNSASTQASQSAATGGNTPTTTNVNLGTATKSAGPTDVPLGGSTGDYNSLADIAEYYYINDLRTDIPNHVKPSGRDVGVNEQQHMTTYTIGMGVRGSLAYDPNYLINDPPTGDYAALIAGTKTWPVPSGTLGGSEDATHVDDLWHAAVNGRGQYFSASNSVDLSNAIASTLNDVTRAQGTASAAAASTLTPTATDDWLFLTRYDSKDGWNGNLYAFHFAFTASGDPIQPDTDPLKAEWNVRTPLQNRDWTTRKIFFNNGTGTAPVKTDFDYTLMGAAQKLLFDGRCTVAATKLTQCAGTKMSATGKTKADLGANLVNFLRGDTSLLLSNATLDNQVWRSRIYRMGDVVNASPVYVAQPSFRFTDAGYATFVASKANRTKVVYVAANDGMLHAFKVVDKRDSNTSASAAEKATAGDELWAFVPTAVMSELWRLADSDYDNSHRYFVDATPNVGDVWDANASKWRTILVGGLGAGGRGYYALDVTDPLAPTVLWEFSDTNLGLTYGNPVITKNKAGTWVVAFTSGINNVSPGDGLGRLYIVDAITGRTISGQDALVTNVGSTTTPSNLGRLNAWVVKDTDNTALRYYAGDMLGNLWRFDADDLWPPSGREAFLLGQALTSTGDPQPITAKPMLTEISVGGALVPLISFGTGRFLGDRDVTDSTLQTFYTVKDTLLGTGLGTLRDARANLVHLQLDSSRALTSKPVIDWNANNGWYVDLTVTSRERVYLDASPIASSVIAFASVAPTGDPCSAGGESWLYLINLKSGELSFVENYKTPVVGLGRVEGLEKVYPLVTTQDGLGSQGDGITKGGDIEPVTRRTSWRELQE